MPAIKESEELASRLMADMQVSARLSGHPSKQRCLTLVIAEAVPRPHIYDYRFKKFIFLKLTMCTY